MATTTAGSETLSLPAAGPLGRQGIGVVDDAKGETVLLSASGSVVARGPGTTLVQGGGDWLVSVEDDRVALTRAAPDRPIGFAGDCTEGDATAAVAVARCGGSLETPDRIDIRDGDGTRTLVTTPPVEDGMTTVGHWRTVAVSPDQSTVLAQWSGECEVPVVFFISIATGAVVTATGESRTGWVGAPSSTAAGWRHDGRAVIALGDSACGTSFESGVYLAAPGNEPQLLYATDEGLPGVFMWQRASHACSSGLSPARFSDQSGTHAVVVTAVDTANRSVEFDAVRWLSGDEATRAYRRDHPDQPDGPPNDYYIVNENPTLRTAVAEPDAVVRLVRLMADGDADLDFGVFEELPDYVDDASGTFWLTFDDGSVTAICEQYRP